jgi:hypothetical protein
LITIYTDDLRKDDSVKGLNNLGYLSWKLVETGRDILWFGLKFVLILSMATSVEIVFSAINFVKGKSRNKISDALLDGCLVTFIERDIFLDVNEDDIMKTFVAIRKHRPQGRK